MECSPKLSYGKQITNLQLKYNRTLKSDSHKYLLEPAFADYYRGLFAVLWISVTSLAGVHHSVLAHRCSSFIINSKYI